MKKTVKDVNQNRQCYAAPQIYLDVLCNNDVITMSALDGDNWISDDFL